MLKYGYKLLNYNNKSQKINLIFKEKICLALSLFAAYFYQISPKNVQKSGFNLDALTIFSHYGSVTRVLGILRSHSMCRYRVLTDIVVVDRPASLYRFHLKYLITTQLYNSRVVVTTFVSSIVPTVTSLFVFQNSNWSERECWDMYGVSFLGHLDLRRILTDYGFNGHPLRKDFPLTGVIEIRYSTNENSIVYEKPSFTQYFRNFSYRTNNRASKPELSTYLKRKWFMES